MSKPRKTASVTAAPPAVPTLAFAVLGGLSAWMVRLVAGSSLVGYACAAGVAGVVTLYAVSAVALVATAASLRLCQRLRRRAERFPADSAWQGVGFAVRVGVLLNAISVVLIAAESSLIPFVAPCRLL